MCWRFLKLNSVYVCLEMCVGSHLNNFYEPKESNSWSLFSLSMYIVRRESKPLANIGELKLMCSALQVSAADRNFNFNGEVIFNGDRCAHKSRILVWNGYGGKRPYPNRHWSILSSEHKLMLWLKFRIEGFFLI